LWSFAGPGNFYDLIGDTATKNDLIENVVGCHIGDRSRDDSPGCTLVVGFRRRIRIVSAS
jgi:hypothetical protein